MFVLKKNIAMFEIDSSWSDSVKSMYISIFLLTITWSSTLHKIYAIVFFLEVTVFVIYHLIIIRFENHLLKEMGSSCFEFECLSESLSLARHVEDVRFKQLLICISYFLASIVNNIRARAGWHAHDHFFEDLLISTHLSPNVHFLDCLWCHMFNWGKN